MSGELQDAYVEGRAALGPLAQGPAAILSRVGDTCIFGVDALGLRPLWHVETEDEHVFASERGFVPLERYIADPYPLGPGERVALRRDGGWRFLDQKAVREQFVAARRARGLMLDGLRERMVCGGPAEAVHAGRRWEIGVAPDEVEDVAVRRERQFAALGFEPDDLKQAAYMAETGNEPIGSLGYDGPLAPPPVIERPIRPLTVTDGGVLECDTVVGPVRLTDHMAITEWVPGEAMGVRHTGLVTGEGRFTLTPVM